MRRRRRSPRRLPGPSRRLPRGHGLLPPRAHPPQAGRQRRPRRAAAPAIATGRRPLPFATAAPTVERRSSPCAGRAAASARTPRRRDDRCRRPPLTPEPRRSTDETARSDDMAKKKILMVLTSHDQLGDTGKKTGFWLEEFAAPYYVFKDAGARDHAGLAQGRPAAARPEERRARRADRRDAALQGRRRGAGGAGRAPPLSEVAADGFDAVFYPGGHGPLWDLAEDATRSPSSSGVRAPASRSPRSATRRACCATSRLRRPAAGEGQAGDRLHQHRGGGGPADQGRAVPGRGRAEAASAALYEKAADWASIVVTDGRLVTGQNPASSEPAATRCSTC